MNALSRSRSPAQPCSPAWGRCWQHRVSPALAAPPVLQGVLLLVTRRGVGVSHLSLQRPHVLGERAGPVLPTSAAKTRQRPLTGTLIMQPQTIPTLCIPLLPHGDARRVQWEPGRRQLPQIPDPTLACCCAPPRALCLGRPERSRGQLTGTEIGVTHIMVCSDFPGLDFAV